MDIPTHIHGIVNFTDTYAPWLRSSQQSKKAYARGIKRYRGIGPRMAELKETRNGRCLLSLDGGGIRGFSQLFILDEVAHRIMRDLSLQESPPLCDYFDMIGGVGTGGYLAILAGRLGLTVSQLKDELRQLLEQVLAGPVSPNELDEFLKGVIKRYTGDSETLLFDPNSPTSHCKTFVGAITAGNVSYLTIFRSYESREPSPNVPIWQAARATLSDRELFPQARINSGSFEQTYLSGEMGWKNPSNEIIREFEAFWPSQNIACLASIGSGHKGVIQINGSAVLESVENAMEQIATDSEKIAQEVAYRFQGKESYFRLNVEQGLQQSVHRRALTLPEVETHTRSYLKSPEAEVTLEQLVQAVLNIIEASVWTTTRDHFETTIDRFISEYSKLVEGISLAAVQLAAQEVVLLLESIRHVRSSEDHWLAFTKTVFHQSMDINDRMVKLREPLAPNPLWIRIKDYFMEIKNVREKLKELLKINPHRVWGSPTHGTFLAKATRELDECFKRIPNAVLNEILDHIVSTKRDAEFDNFISWISRLDMEKRHQDILAKRTTGTGGWFVETAEFKVWRDSQKPEGCRVLLGFGDPGAGKTFICCSTTEHLRAILQKRRAALTFIYCDYRDQDKQDPCSMIGELAKQLLLQAPSVPEEAWPLYQKHTAITTKKAQQIFSLMALSFDLIYVCIDALDECQPEFRDDVLRFLTTLKGPTLRILCTGRSSVTPEVTEIVGSVGLETIEIFAHEEDVRLYLEEKLSRDRHKRAMDQHLREQITKELVSHKLFILAAFQLEFLLRHITKRARREALKKLPKELFEVYEATFVRIKQQPSSISEMAVEALTWIYLARRKLQIHEVQHALATRTGDPAFVEDGIPDEDYLLDCCLGLVVIEQETSTIRLAHFTLQEYLDQHWQEYFPSGHSAIASTCITYLAFDIPFLTEIKLLRSRGLLGYAAKYLGDHLAQDTNPELDGRTLELMTDKAKFQIIAELVFNEDRWTDADDISSPLQWAAYFGVTSVAKLMLKSKVDSSIKIENNNGKGVLSLAAQHGHEAMVRLLLAAGIEPDLRDNNLRTPLSHAAQRGHEAVVKVLLGVQGVEADSRDIKGRTPLSWAATRSGVGETWVKQAFSVQGIVADSSDIYKRTSLLFGYGHGHGHEEIVKLLLGAGVDVNSRNKDGRTPILFAALRGREEMVKLLLQTDGADPDATDCYDRTPLSHAAGNGHLAVVKLLLGLGNIQPDSRDSDGRTPLSFAAELGHDAVVKLLLGVETVNANSSDIYGQTPVSFAAGRGHDAVVELLLGAKGVDSNSKNDEGRTALSYAAWSGHEAVVKLLLAVEGVEADSRDNVGRTPLSYAAGRSREAVVKLLFDSNLVDIESQDNDKRSPLSWAAQYDGYTPSDAKGAGNMVRLLLDQYNADPNSKDANGRTPLSYAAEWGRDDVVRVLLERKADVNHKDAAGNTAFVYASRAGSGLLAFSRPRKDHYEKIMKLLLDHGYHRPSKFARNQKIQP